MGVLAGGVTCVGIGSLRRNACNFCIPVPLTALVSITGTAASGESTSKSRVFSVSPRSAASMVCRSASKTDVDGSVMSKGLRLCSFNAESNFCKVLFKPFLVAKSYLVMTITSGNCKARQSCRCACERSKSAAAGPSNSSEEGEAPSLPDDSLVLSAGTHRSVQCGCLVDRLAEFRVHT